MHSAPLLLAALLASSPVVDLHAGEVAPFDGALCDSACAEGLRAKRRGCEIENQKLQELLKQKDDQLKDSPSVVGYAKAFFVGALVGAVLVGSVAAYATLRK